jgi:hypothetical protein
MLTAFVISDRLAISFVTAHLQPLGRAKRHEPLDSIHECFQCAGWTPVALARAILLLQIQRPLDPSRTPSASRATHPCDALSDVAEVRLAADVLGHVLAAIRIKKECKGYFSPLRDRESLIAKQGVRVRE